MARAAVESAVLVLGQKCTLAVFTLLALGFDSSILVDLEKLEKL